MRRRTLAIIGVLLLAIPAVAGTWTSNSFIYKPSTGARGEEEKKIFDNGLDRLDARLAKETWLGDPGGSPGYDTLPHAITTIDSTPTILRLPPGIISITADTTIPANITLKPERGAILDIAAGKTLTISGSLDAGVYQIFSGSGVVNLALRAIPAVYAEWWGAVADNSTDNRTAIRAAIQCLETRGGGTLKFMSRGNYAVSNGTTPGDPGVWVTGDAASGNIIIEGNGATLCGNGPGATSVCNGPILKLGDAASSGPGNNYLFKVVVRDISILGVGSTSSLLATYPYQDGLYIGNSQKISIQDVHIANIARNGIAGKKNTTGSNYRVWNKNVLFNVKVSNCGNAGLCLGRNNHDDPDLQVTDDVTIINSVFSGLGKAYAMPDTGYENTQAGVIVNSYMLTMTNCEVASVYYTTDSTYNDKVTSGRFTAAGWTYGANWAQDATNYEADATTASSDLSQNLANMENTTYTVAFAVRNYSAGTVRPAIGAVAGVAVNANGGYCQTITTGATGTLALKFTGTGFTGSITDVRVMKYPRGLLTGVYIRYVRGLSINGIHYETIGSNQLGSCDLTLEDCSGAVAGYHTYIADSIHARTGIVLTNCGVTINGAHMNNASGYAMNNLIYYAGSTNKCLALSLTNSGTTPAYPKPFGGWVVGDPGPSVFGNMGMFPITGGTYNGNLFFEYNDRYPDLQWRAGTTVKDKIFGDASTGDLYMDITRKLLWRDISGNTKMSLDLSKGVLNLTALTAAPSSPSTGDIACADRVNWDPLSKGSGGTYLVRYNGSAWVAINAQ